MGKKGFIFLPGGFNSVIEELSKKYGVKKAENENELAKESDILILSVKPNIFPKVLDKIKKRL